jgi:hypothetical protein
LWTQILKFVPVDVGACGKQSDGGVSETRLCIQAWKHEVLQVPEDTVLPHSEITLPHIFVGDEAYRFNNLLDITVQQK